MNKYIKMIIWIVWFIYIVVWNYIFPDAKPHEDVLVTILLLVWSKALERHLR